MRHLILLLLCATTLAAADPNPPTAPDMVIYPRAVAEKRTVAADTDGWNRAPWLVGALALAAGATWWLWRSRARGGPGGHAGHRLGIEETRSLGNRQYLVIATYEEKKLLLAVTPGRIKLLCELPGNGKAGP